MGSPIYFLDPCVSDWIRPIGYVESFYFTYLSTWIGASQSSLLYFQHRYDLTSSRNMQAADEEKKTRLLHRCFKLL